MSEVDQGTVKEVTITGMEVRGKLQDGSRLPHHRSGELPGHEQGPPGQKSQRHLS